MLGEAGPDNSGAGRTARLDGHQVAQDAVRRRRAALLEAGRGSSQEDAFPDFVS